MKKLILALLSMVSVAASAGDFYNYESLGFSADGRYYAFLQDGEHDGSGFYFVQVDIVDVESNRLIKREYSNIEEEFNLWEDPEVGEDEYWKNPTPWDQKLRKIVLERVGIKNYGIDGSTPGEVLLERQDTDYSQYTSTVFALYANAHGGTIPMAPTYELKLTQTPTSKSDDNEWCWTGEYLLKMTLESKNHYDGSNPSVVLQDDKRLPKSRRCAYDYSIKAVYTHNDRIAVRVQYNTVGFEGPNYESIVVTGNLHDVNH